MVLNGSRLGKEYVANAIVDRLETPNQYEHLTNTQPKSSTQFTPQPQPVQEPQTYHHTEQHPESNELGNSIGSLFDIPIVSNGNDYEEDEFRRRMQQQKKKRGRRI